MKIRALVFTSLIGAASAFGQQYEYSLIGPIVSDDEEIVDAATSGWILVRDLSTAALCPVAYNIQSKETHRLCEEGLTQAYAINKSGEVAGYVDEVSSREAAVWRPGKGTVKLGFLQPGDTISEALAINDSGTIVGFSSPVISRSCSQGSEEFTHTDPRAFISNGTRLRQLRKKADGKASIAVAVNQSGSTLMYVSGGPISQDEDTCGTESRTNAAHWLVRTPSGKELHRRIPTYVSFTFDFYSDRQTSAVGFHEHVIGFDREHSILNGNVLLKSSGKKRDVGGRFNGRYDYADSGQILSASGQVAGVTGSAFVELRPGAAVGIDCLAPANRFIKNQSLTTESLHNSGFKLGGFDRTGRLFFSGDVFGDSKNSRVIAIAPLEASKRGIYNDFCPDAFANLHQVTGSKVSVSLQLSSPIDTYEGVTAELRAYASSDEETCPDTVVAEAQVHRSSQAAEVFLPPLDQRFTYYWSVGGRFTVEPTYVLYADFVQTQCIEYGR